MRHDAQREEHMFRRLESLFAALGVLAAFGGAYFFAALTKMGFINLWSLLGFAAAALCFFGISASVHGHKPHTRITIIAGFLLSAATALIVKSKFGSDIDNVSYAFLPEAGLLLLVLLCAEIRVFIKEPANRKPEHVGAARAQPARRKRAS